jgi:glucose-6-phosphate 1-epimerase
LPFIRVRTQACEADVYLHGATVTHFQPAGEKPVLYLSPNSNFAAGKAIRGGIPVCWPWFGPHPTDSTQPQHGYARTAEWMLTSAAASPTGDVTLTLVLDTPIAQLSYETTFGRSMTCKLSTTNRTDQPLRITQALHTYLAVADVRQITVDGVGGLPYLDRAPAGKGTQPVGPIRFTAEFDRTFLNATQDVTVTDPVWNRRLTINRTGSRSTVVWNPWIAKSTSLADLGGEAWPNFVCVEATNAADDAVSIAPGASTTLGTRVSTAPK